MAAHPASPLLDDRFLPLEALGRGGAGRVVRAFDRTRQEMVALKVLDVVARPGPAHPLSGEFEAWARLRHPNVVRVHELRRTRSGPLPSDTPYLVLEHVDGDPAHRALPPHAASEDALLAVARQVLAALGHVHDSGLVHRDIKPGNVLVRRGRGALRVKLTDFGLASAPGSADRPGFVSGSLPYVAPETLLGQPVDGRADLYGLGLLLYVVASGTLPMGTDAPPEAVLAWHLHGPELDVRARRPDLSPRFARFVARLAARERDRRPADPEEALALVGSAPRKREAGMEPVPRAEVATVRLALDAARLGARRLLLASRGALEETAVRAQILGLPVTRLGPDLAACVLDLLVERGPGVADVLRRHGLAPGLPLSIFGGLPIWDRLRTAGAAGTTTAHERTAAGIAALIADAAGRIPRVVLVPGNTRGREDLLARTVEHVVRAVEREPSAPGRSGGLLVVLETGPGRDLDTKCDQS